MSLSASALANQLKPVLELSSVTSQLSGFCSDLIAEVKGASATFALIPMPHPISGMDGNSLADKIIESLGFDIAPPDMMKAIINAMVDHIQNDGYVEYTQKPPSPPAIPPNLAWSEQGKIRNLSGTAMVNAIVAVTGPDYNTAKYKNFCNTICTYLMSNASVNFGVFS